MIGGFLDRLNNADLLTVSTYYRWVPAFSRMIMEEDGDLAAFFERVKTVGKLPRQQRESYLNNLLKLQG